MNSIILNEKSIGRFRDNVNNERYMICWCYYDGCYDICQTRYSFGEFALNARGIGYFNLFSDQNIEDCSLEGLQKYIHSFLEIEEPTP